MANYVDINAEQGNLHHPESREKFHHYLFILFIVLIIIIILLVGAYWIDMLLVPLKH